MASKPKPKLTVFTNPKLDKAANGNSPKPKSAKPSPITFDEKPGRFTQAGQKGPKAQPPKAPAGKPQKTNAPHDAKKIWDSQARKGAKPKSSPITFDDKPKAGNRFTSKLGEKAAKPAAKAASTTASTVSRTLGTGAKVGIKLLGAAALPLDMIANAKPAGEGSDKPIGKPMRGNRAANGGGGMSFSPKLPSGKPAKAAPLNLGSMTKVESKGPGSSYPNPGKAAKANPNLGYGNFNPVMPKATGSESVGAKAPSHGGGGYPAGKAPSASVAPSSSAPQSSKAPGVGTSGMNGTATQRGGVRTLQTRYERDDIDMNSRKRK
jgi:hypothetical protein